MRQIQIFFENHLFSKYQRVSEKRWRVVPQINKLYTEVQDQRSNVKSDYSTAFYIKGYSTKNENIKACEKFYKKDECPI